MAAASESTGAWLEYAKLAVSALTPIVGGVVAYVVTRLAAAVDRNKSINQEPVKKRIKIFEEVSLGLNDIYCFYLCVGHWSMLDQPKILATKRSIDRNFYINRYLLSKDCFTTYLEFIHEYFEPYTGAALPTKLRLDVGFVKEQIGPKFDSSWAESISTKLGSRKIQKEKYEKLMHCLGDDIRDKDRY
jgi:hypothetical protein